MIAVYRLTQRQSQEETGDSERFSDEVRKGQVSAGQTVIAQQDRQPVAGFAPTSKWKPGQRIRDNYGFIVPANTPPGPYELWLTIYLWPSLDKLPITGADGKPIEDQSA